MNFDLNVRSKNLEKEQIKRREDAKKRREKEILLKANHLKNEQNLQG